MTSAGRCLRASCRIFAPGARSRPFGGFGCAVIAAARAVTGMTARYAARSRAARCSAPSSPIVTTSLARRVRRGREALTTFRSRHEDVDKTDDRSEVRIDVRRNVERHRSPPIAVRIPLPRATADQTRANAATTTDRPDVTLRPTSCSGPRSASWKMGAPTEYVAAAGPITTTISSERARWSAGSSGAWADSHAHGGLKPAAPDRLLDDQLSERQ